MHIYTVSDNEPLTHTTQLLTLEKAEHSRPFAFQPGQYAAISFLRRGNFTPARCFSIVSSPTDQDNLQFAMRVKGRFTKAVATLQKGDEVHVLGPYGGFVFDAGRDKKTVMMAGGIGITPLMSMIRYIARLEDKNEITLLYSSQSQEDLPFKEELIKIEQHNPNIKVIFVIGDGKTDKLPSHHSETGFITADILDKVTGGSYADTKFFICGPPMFMKAMTGVVMKKGVPRSRLMTEAFSQATPRQTGILRSWPANVYALGALGVVLGSIVVMVADLIRTLPPMSSVGGANAVSGIGSNSRQETLDQLVNSIPPSPEAIPSPSSNTNSATSTPQSAPQTIVQPPIYSAPQPRTTASAPPP